MKIQCNCRGFQAELTAFPRNTPGRLMCYCDDCQNYLEKLGRTDLLDGYGGTEVIPVYPSEIKFLQGQEHLRCNRFGKRGLSRWSTTCCNSPIVNTRARFPWAGVFHSAYTVEDKDFLEKFGRVRCRIRGKYATGNPPFKISDDVGLKAMMIVLPFVLKGKILKKDAPSPFFKEDGKTPISEVVIL